MLAEVESLPAPDDVNRSKESLFLPTLSRLAFTLQSAVMVWDAQDSKFLLNFLGADKPANMSFSLDGRFFACGTAGWEIYLWRESPVGYALHQRDISNICGFTSPLLSPSGESTTALNYSTIQLWRTEDPTTSPSPSSIPTQPAANFILEFSPDETSAAVVRLRETMATVLDLKSGDPRLVVDTGMTVLGLRVTGSAVVVVGEGKVVTWNLPVSGDWALDVNTDINDSVRIACFDYSAPPCPPLVHYASVSPDVNRIAVTRCTVRLCEGLGIYDLSTGKCLAATTTQGFMPWFTPDGREVWCIEDVAFRRKTTGWTITEDIESGLAKLERLGPTGDPSGGFPWRSPRGYKVTRNGWVVSASGKRLLWLPHRWRSDEEYRVWGGRFLGLSHRELPEAVILELDE